MAGGVDGISQEWWGFWWEEDWSWEGLAQKPWEGWIVPEPGAEPVPDEGYDGRNHPDLRVRFGANARPATLQDYWRDQSGKLIKWQDANGKRWQFTSLHLPLLWPDGTSTGKAAWADDRLDRLIEAKLNAVHDRGFDPTDSWPGEWQAQLQGVIFLQFDVRRLSLRKLTETRRVQISLRCNACAFLIGAWFGEVTFAGNSWFDRASFSSVVVFGEALFDREVSFNKAVFAGTAWFHETIFCGRAMFANTIFDREAIFYGASFMGQASFIAGTFIGQTSFSSAVFYNEAWFSKTAFVDRAYFDKVTFSGHVSFNGIGASITTDPISGTLKFGALGKVIRTGEPHTTELNFPKRTNWIAQRSFSDVSFQSTVFLNSVQFGNRDFLSETPFTKTIFLREVAFHNSKLHRGISFRDTQIKSGLERGKGLPEIEAQFQPSWDAALERLHACEKRTADMQNSPAPEFQTWKKDFTQKRQTAEDEFLISPQDEQSAYYGTLEDSYRTLKQLMEDKRDRGQEARFFKLELKARRKRRDRHVPWWERQASDVYGAISDFGTSIVRPLGWLAGSVFVFAIAYWIMGTWFAFSPSWQGWGDALSFSLGRVLPFGPWSEPDACGLIGQLLDLSPEPGAALCEVERGRDYTLIPGTPILFRLLASFQSLSAIILVFLSGLAVRRKFQIN